MLPVHESVRKAGSIGILLPNLEARLIVDDTNLPDGKAAVEAKPGEAGELWIRGPNVMKVLLTCIRLSASLRRPYSRRE